MLKVKAEVKPSTIPGAGLGLFASEDITKGTIVWEFDPSVDTSLSQDEVLRLPPEEQAKIWHHGYLSTQTQRWIICSDGAQYVNHSPFPNLAQAEVETSQEMCDIAVVDIRAGDELLDDYYAYDAAAESKLKQ